MHNTEKYGREICKKCLPPVRYNLNPGGMITLSVNTGRAKLTEGCNHPSSMDFMQFLSENDALEAFITCSFSGRNMCSATTYEDDTSIERWISAHFHWASHRVAGIPWETLDDLWRAKVRREGWTQ